MRRALGRWNACLLAAALVFVACSSNDPSGANAPSVPAPVDTVDAGKDCQVTSEVCDGKDNDCNGVVDDGASLLDCEQREGVGRVCRGGACVCALTCDGQCVDGQTNPAHCGACENACAPGSTCVAGACSCGAGQTRCGGVCVDTKVDVANCGQCGAVCAASSAQSAARCEVGTCRIVTTLASGLNKPIRIVVDDKYAYVASNGENILDNDNGSIIQVPKDGSGPAITLAAEQSPIAMVVTHGYVYWMNTPRTEPTSTLFRVPIGGGKKETIVAGIDRATGLAADATHLYFQGDDQLEKVPLDGGTPIPLAPMTENVTGIEVADGDVYFGTMDSPSALVRVPVGGGAAVKLVTEVANLGPIQRVVVDATHIYVLEFFGKLQRMPRAGGPLAMVAQSQDINADLAVDDGRAYIATSNDDFKILSAPKGGGPMSLIGHADAPFGIAVDGPYLYWVNAVNFEAGEGSVVRMNK
jgi:hypothetical protein